MSIERVTLTSFMFGQLIQNVMHFNNPDGVLTGAQIAEELRVNFCTVIKSSQNANYTWNSCTVQRLSSPLPSSTTVAFVPIPGALAGTTSQTMLAVVFRVRTGLAGRKNRGRFYIAGVQPDNVQLNIMLPAAVVLWQNIATSLSNRYKSGGTGPINIGVMTRGDTSSFKLATSISIATIFGSQRRRNTGVGS
jgi:hypothetical protein